MKHITQKGFTLIEMITVLAIFGVISSIVIFNYGKFRNDTILTNMAYEVALSIREAQIYGVSSRVKSSADYKVPYGIYLTTGSSQYHLFADTGDFSDYTPDGVFSGTSCAYGDMGADECVIPYTLQRNVVIHEIKESSGASCAPPVNAASIVFKRPNPEPVIALGPAGSLAPVASSFIEITLMAPDGTKRYVTIFNNGQIAVENEFNHSCGN